MTSCSISISSPSALRPIKRICSFVGHRGDAVDHAEARGPGGLSLAGVAVDEREHHIAAHLRVVDAAVHREPGAFALACVDDHRGQLVLCRHAGPGAQALHHGRAVEPLGHGQIVLVAQQRAARRDQSAAPGAALRRPWGIDGRGAGCALVVVDDLEAALARGARVLDGNARDVVGVALDDRREVGGGSATKPQRVTGDPEQPVLEDIAGEQRDEGLIDRDDGRAAITLIEGAVLLLEKRPPVAGLQCLAAAGPRAAVGGHRFAAEVEELDLDTRGAATDVLDAQPGVLLAEVEGVRFAARRVGEGREGERRGEQRKQRERPEPSGRREPQAHERALHPAISDHTSDGSPRSAPCGAHRQLDARIAAVLRSALWRLAAPSGCSSAWQSASFGTTRSAVQICAPRPSTPPAPLRRLPTGRSDAGDARKRANGASAPREPAP